jgi:integrase
VTRREPLHVAPHVEAMCRDFSKPTRDRALIALMTYTFARVRAALAMSVDDYYRHRDRWWVRLHEKGGERHEMPAHHNLEAYLGAYVEVAGLKRMRKSPLFRSARRRSGELTTRGLSRVDVFLMIRRRASAAGLSVDACCHTFRRWKMVTCSKEIPREAGFGDREWMRRSFLRTFGQTPQAIRNASHPLASI